MLYRLTKKGQSSCATAVQAASKTTLHACKTRSSNIGTLREWILWYVIMNAFASVHCTALHNFFRPLAFLLNRKEHFRVKRVKPLNCLTTIFTNFKSSPIDRKID
jgi:hypothetical protein